MAQNNIICGIDIGNSTVKTVLSEINPETNRPRIIGIGTAPSNGLRRGVVVDMEEVINSIKRSLIQAETMSGIRPTEAYVAVSGQHIKTQTSRGVVAVSRADNEIGQSDIDRVVEAASTISLPQNYEIIHIIPRNFVIDGQEIVKNPLGMKGIRLEVEVMLIEGLSTYIHNLTRAINANNIDVAELVYAPLAASKSILDKHQREYGVLLLDIGGGVTSMILFHEGDLLHTAVLPIGAKHVTNDLAIAFRTSIGTADAIKHAHGFIGTSDKHIKQTVDLSEVLNEPGMIIPKKQIGKIIGARVAELFDVVSAELKKTPGTRVLPAGLVLAGGGANLEGMTSFSKEELGLSTRIGTASAMEGLSEAAIDPSFAVATGLVLWGMEDEILSGRSASRSSGSAFFSKIGKWLKNFMP